MILVRHARSVVDASTRPADWVLAPDARDAAALLGRHLGHATAVVASTEPKAVATAHALGLGAVTTSDAFCEVPRPWYGDADGLTRHAARWFAGEPVDGWETRADAVARFDSGLRGRERAGLVVVTHGTVMTAWLAAQGLVDDAAEFWSQLRMPDAWQVGRTLVRCPTE